MPLLKVKQRRKEILHALIGKYHTVLELLKKILINSFQTENLYGSKWCKFGLNNYRMEFFLFVLIFFYKILFNTFELNQVNISHFKRTNNNYRKISLNCAESFRQFGSEYQQQQPM